MAYSLVGSEVPEFDAVTDSSCEVQVIATVTGEP